MKYLLIALLLAGCTGGQSALPSQSAPMDSVGGGLPANAQNTIGAPDDTPGGPILKADGIESGFNSVDMDNQFSTNQFFRSEPLGCTDPDGGILPDQAFLSASIKSEGCSVIMGDAADPKFQCEFSTQPVVLLKQGEYSDCSAEGNIARWNLVLDSPQEPNDNPGGPILKPDIFQGVDPNDTPGGPILK